MTVKRIEDVNAQKIHPEEGISSLCWSPNGLETFNSNRSNKSTGMFTEF